MHKTNVRNVTQANSGLSQTGSGTAKPQTKHIPHNNLKKEKMPIQIAGGKAILQTTKTVSPDAPLTRSGIFIVTNVNNSFTNLSVDQSVQRYIHLPC